MDWKRLKTRQHRPVPRIVQTKPQKTGLYHRPKIAFVVANMHWGGTFGFMLNLGNSLGDDYEKQYIGWHGKRVDAAIAAYKERAQGSKVFYAGASGDDLVAAVQSFDPDIVVYTGPVNVPGLLSPHARAKFMYVAHTTDTWSDAGIDYGGGRIHTVIGAGLGICEHYREKYGKSNVVSLLGASTHFREPAIRSRKIGLRIGYFGNFEPRKKAYEILEAFRKFRKAQDRLLMAGGEAPYASRYLDKLKKAAHNDPTISFQVNIRDRNTVLEAMDVMVVYSDWEGWPQTMIEAMAVGVPIIARRVCGPSVYHLEIPEGAITYIDSLDELGAAVDRLRNYEVRKQQAEKAYLFAKERHSLDRLRADAKPVFDVVMGIGPQPTYVVKPIEYSTLVRGRHFTGTDPVVSVNMPVFNTNPAFLREALESVLSQAGVSFELVISDDGSTDRGTVAVLEEYVGHPHVVVLRNKHAGIVEARNAALRASLGRYVAVLDSDDTMVPGRLFRQVEYLEAHPEVALVSGQMKFIDEHGMPTGGFSRKGITNFALPPGKMIWELPWTIGHSTVCYKRSAVSEVGGYASPLPNRLAQDFDLWCRLHKAGYSISVLSEVFCHYRMHAGQVTHTHKPTEAMRDIAALYHSVPSVGGPDAVFFYNGIGNFVLATPFFQNLNNPTIFTKESQRAEAFRSISNWPVKSITEFNPSLFARSYVLWCFPRNELPPGTRAIYQADPTWEDGRHEMQFYLDLLPGAEVKPPLVKTEHGWRLVSGSGERLIALANGAAPTWEYKRWPAERFVELAKKLCADDSVQLVYLGDAGEAATGEYIRKAVGNRCWNFAGRLSLSVVADVLSQCDLLVCNDTGLMHVADAVGCRIVVVWGSTLWSKNYPVNGVRTNTALRVQGDGGGCPRFPCFPKTGDVKRHRCTQPVCMQAISAEQVYEAIHGIL